MQKPRPRPGICHLQIKKAPGLHKRARRSKIPGVAPIQAESASIMKLLLPLLLLFALPALGPAAEYQAACSIDFRASATLHDFQGTGRCQPFTASETGGVLQIPEVSVPVASLETGNIKRDRQMREMFEAEKFPLIVGHSGAISLSVLRQALANRTIGTPDIPIRLRIRDIEREIVARVGNYLDQEGRIAADLEFTVSLAEYQLEPPSILGIIRVGDRVDVTASFVLKPR